MKLLSRVQLFEIPWTESCQPPLSLEFSRQEYWSEWPFPSPGDLSDPGIEPMSSALIGKFFTAELLREAQVQIDMPIILSFPLEIFK